MVGDLSMVSKSGVWIRELFEVTWDNVGTSE